MDTQHRQWKCAIDELWSAHTLDHMKAARLVAEIAQRQERGFLQHAAAQALPSMRHAAMKSADQMTRAMARRRFSAVRDALHTLTGPRFGKRRDAAKEPADPEEEHRRVLGLPSGRPLFAPEIRQAYKRAAKRMHPDAGGSERAFLELSAARDALMKKE
jgi:hypothetical protein